jgi:general secretion pathway protein H
MGNQAAKRWMQTLATGTWTSSQRPVSAGFTLVEILVVLVIIGLMVVGALLSIHTASSDSVLDKERNRMIAIMDYLRDQATLEGREYGIRFFEGGYEFLVYNSRDDAWLRLENDNLTQARQLPAGLDMTVLIEGRKIILPPAKIKDEERKPHVLLFSSGEMNLFELTLEREGVKKVRFKPGSASENIEVTEVLANPA